MTSSPHDESRVPTSSVKLGSGALAQVFGDVETSELAVVVLSDIFGAIPAHHELCRHLAAEHRWVVCGVDSLPGVPAGDLAAREEALSTVDEMRQLADAVEAGDLLGPGPAGLIGFCIGGTLAIKAASLARFHRIVSFYGIVTQSSSWLGPNNRQPLPWLTGESGRKILHISGSTDPYISQADLQSLQQRGARMVHYDGVGHAFAHDAARPSYASVEARDAWHHASLWLRS